MISDDQKRIEFLNATRFDSPAFLRCAVKHGLLKGTSSSEEAYSVFGKLLRIESLREKRAELGMVRAIESLTAAELLSVRENVSGVVPFRSSK